MAFIRKFIPLLLVIVLLAGCTNATPTADNNPGLPTPTGESAGTNPTDTPAAVAQPTQPAATPPTQAPTATTISTATSSPSATTAASATTVATATKGSSGSNPAKTNTPRPDSPTATSNPNDSSATPTLTPTKNTNPNALISGAVMLVTLGDGLTEGKTDESGQGYPGRILTVVGQARFGTQLQNYGSAGATTDIVINGVQGQSSQLSQGVAAMQYAKDNQQPGLALVWVGYDDILKLYNASADPMTAAAEKTNLDTFQKNLEKILSSLHDTNATIIIGTLDDLSKRPAIATPASTPAYPNITSDDLPRMSKQVQAYNQVINTLATQYKANVADFSSSDIFTNAQNLSDDHMNPNATGFDLISKVWLAIIQPLL